MPKKNEIDKYIALFPESTQEIMEQIRATIKKTAPDAEEIISYKMPAYKQNGEMLVYFAAYKNHLGFYPTSTGIEAFKIEFTNYKWSKGAVQFPLNEPLPTKLIERIVKFKIKLSQEKANAKKKK